VRIKNCHTIIALLTLTFLSTVICTVDAYQWRSNFGPITLPKISHKADVVEGSTTVTLEVVDVNFTQASISADNTVNGPAELTNGKDRLVTEYKLSFSGNGITTTGGSDTSYATYDTFLKDAPAVIKYKTGFNTVDVTLHVRASNIANNVADSGLNNAKQTLTVAW
jgi:hypothetical protein